MCGKELILATADPLNFDNAQILSIKTVGLSLKKILHFVYVLGCWSAEDKVYKNGEIWKEGDCVTCHCVEGKKQCQAEMCVKTCIDPVYVPGRCCPICEGKIRKIPVIYNNESCFDKKGLNALQKKKNQKKGKIVTVVKIEKVNCFGDKNIGHISERAFMFHTCIPCGQTFLFGTKFKVKYQGHVFQKMAVAGAFMFLKHILLDSLLNLLIRGRDFQLTS